ncbi:MAG: NTP transferase domain-containing protein [Actinomycetota bacterium]
MSHPQPVAIVLCGGTSRRMEGHDKTRELLGGTTVLDHLLNGLPSSWAAVCVGDERATTRSVQWCRESPTGGGPVAAIAAGLDHLAEADGGHQERDESAQICVVVGGDMPFAGAALVNLVDALTAQPSLDGVLASDPGGRQQPLLAAYRCLAFRAALPGEPAGARVMGVVDAMATGTVPCAARFCLDVDTPEALEQARHIVEG